jgi:hypothetical protein
LLPDRFYGWTLHQPSKLDTQLTLAQPLEFSFPAA